MFGKEKKKPSDFFSGHISMDGQQIFSVFGSYMGFIEFDGVRYWDYREYVTDRML